MQWIDYPLQQAYQKGIFQYMACQVVPASWQNIKRSDAVLVNPKGAEDSAKLHTQKVQA